MRSKECPFKSEEAEIVTVTSAFHWHMATNQGLEVDPAKV